jgi:hypothetical protein
MRIGDQPEAQCDWNGRSHMAPGFLFPLVGAYDRNMVNVIVSGNVRAAPEEVFRFLADLENLAALAERHEVDQTRRGSTPARSARSINTSRRRWA